VGNNCDALYRLEGPDQPPDFGAGSTGSTSFSRGQRIGELQACIASAT